MIGRVKHKKSRANGKVDPLLTATLFSFLIITLFRIPLSNMLSNNGMAYFAPASEIYLLAGIFLSGALTVSLEGLIKYRIRREQYMNAEKVFRSTMWVAVIIGLAGSLLLLFLCRFIADIMILESYSAMAIAMMAFSIFFIVLTGVFRGYFQGIGSRVPSMHSMILEKIIFIGFSFFFISAFGGYGDKVADILHKEEYKWAYQSMGGAAALLLASILTMLHMIVLSVLYNRNIKKQRAKDTSRVKDTSFNIYRLLFVSAMPYAICMLCFASNTFIQQRIFYYYGNLREMSAQNASAWGIYYGKYMGIVGSLAILCCMIPGNQLKRITSLIERDEIREAKFVIKLTVHKIILFAMPAAIFVSVLAQVIAALCGKGDQTLLYQGFLYGSTTILLLPLVFLLIGILVYLKQYLKVILFAVPALIANVIVCSLILANTSLQIEGVILGNIMHCLILLVLGYLDISKRVSYKPEWLRQLAVPIIAAGVAGMIQLLLKALLHSAAGDLLTLLICLVIGIVIYCMLLIVLRGVKEEELSQIPGGFILIRVAKAIHFM